MDYPSLLAPTTTEDIRLPSGNQVSIPKTQPTFELWKRPPIADTYGGKEVLSLNGEPVFAELLILRMLQNDGWSGVWVDAYRRKYRTSYFPANEVELADRPMAVLEAIYARAGKRTGCWDVFCWREGGEFMFAESKRQKHDRIRTSQQRWLEAAIQYGLPTSSFLIVESSVSEGG